MKSIFFNNEKIDADTTCISPFDRGFTLGHGLFETILWNANLCPLLNVHWRRLVKSCQILGFDLPWTFTTLEAQIKELAQANEYFGQKAVVRVSITDGVSARGILTRGSKPTTVLTLSAFPHLNPPALSATIVKTRRNEHSLASKIKSISYMDNILAKTEAHDAGFDEAFLLNSQGFLAEGATSNIFAVKNKMVYTPFINDGALPGVIRHLLLNKSFPAPVSIEKKCIDPEFIKQADEIFITNALLGIKPIYKLDEMIFSSPFPVTKTFASLLKNNFNYI